MECEGPLIWFDVVGGYPELGGILEDGNGALLSCTSCDYLTQSGNFNDEAHHNADLVHEGL
jgi:hypothetical protein